MLIDSLIGFVGFVLTAVGFNVDKPGEGIVSFKFLSGKDGINQGTELSDSGGILPWIAIKSTSNEWIGRWQYQNKKLRNNDQANVYVSLNRNQEISYISLDYHSTDAVCIALIRWQPNDNIHNSDVRKGMLTGDIFRLCGYPWNYSGQGLAAESGYTYVSCGWMSADRDFVRQFNINLDVMSTYFIKDYKNTNLCGFGVGFARANGKKRSLSAFDEQSSTFGNQVRVHKELSAIALCDSPMSWGSSLFSIDEGIFCDMSTKTKIPVCKAGDKDGCFIYEKPSVTNGRNGYSTKRNVRVKGSTTSYNATYFIITDGNGKTLDDGRGV
jgi:hypothetical protein